MNDEMLDPDNPHATLLGSNGDERVNNGGMIQLGQDMLSKGAKVGTGIAAGGTSLLLVVSMLNGRLDEVNKRIDEKDKQIREFVELRHDQVLREMTYVRDGQHEIKDILKTIQNHVYRRPRGE